MPDQPHQPHQPHQPDQPDQPDQVLGGRYRIVRHLARGGMAEVYLAHDELLDRPVAVKVMFPALAEDPSFVERFRREARSAALLNHPNIVSVYDVGNDPQGYFIVMEYVAGHPLSEVIATAGPMPPAQAIGVAADVAAGLAEAHREGIVHRDVKPANVLIAPGGAKIADFGIARAADGGGNLTMPGTMIGTATYLSPEQARALPVDARSDLYSLGMVLYEMLTGQAPFRGDNPVAAAYKQQHEVPSPPSRTNPEIPQQLDEVVAKALSFDPARRQQTADQLRTELLAIGQRPADAPTIVAPPLSPTVAIPAAHAGAAPLPSQPPPPRPSSAAAATTIGQAGPPDDYSPRQARRSVYLRRRLVVMVLVVLVVVGAIVGVAALGGGKKSRVTVPPVIGLAVADAVAKVAQAGLKSQVVEQNRPGTIDHVIDQLPVPGSTVNRNSDVSLFVPAKTTTTTARPTATPTTRTAPTTTHVATTAVPVTTTLPAQTTVPRPTTVIRTTLAVPTT